MSRFVGLLLNVLFVYLMYMSYTVGGLWENGFNAVLALYSLLTALLIVISVALVKMPDTFTDGKTLKYMKELKEKRFTWTSILFYVITLPFLAFAGYIFAYAVCLINLGVCWFLVVFSTEAIKSLEDLAKKEGITFEEMVALLDNKE